jgi:D-arabinose 1-dehydrogenase-like Zn-dependent alcohol dehydrogenase
MTSTQIPTRQHAVQLNGCRNLFLNEEKSVPCPGAHQLLVRVEAVGLCCSDLNLLKHFAQHPRKAGVASGIAPDALAEMPNYVPNERPTVPGHEAVVRVVSVGLGVSRYRNGERFLIQPFYRWLPTSSSDAAFGCNFEGALQEYVLLDERVIDGFEGETSMISVPDDVSASALAVVEPWSRVEAAYAEVHRRSLKPDGRCVVVGETSQELDVARPQVSPSWAALLTTAANVDPLKDNAFDDVLYFGSNAETVERLFPKLTSKGLLAICQCGKLFGKPVHLPFGRVPSDGIRLAGTRSASLRAAFADIPVSSEIHLKDRFHVMGAAGPTGTMHVLYALCQGLCISIYASDLNEEKLNELGRIAGPVARSNGCQLETFHSAQKRLAEHFDRIVILAPAAALVQEAVATSAERGIIDISADISADVIADVDLDTYIEKRLYFVGTSSSELKDMQSVLSQIVSGRLNTNLSVAAVSGLDGAIEGMRVLEADAVSGKIIVYPSCHGLPLVPLSELKPLLSADRLWTLRSEQQLLEQWARPSQSGVSTT